MKLYATVTSERASKGQGGNEYIDIDLMGAEGVILGKFVFMVDANDSKKYILVEDNNYHNERLEVKTKGEKQKGEGVCNIGEPHFIEDCSQVHPTK